MTDTPIIDAAVANARIGGKDCCGAVRWLIIAAFRSALPWDLPAERLEAMARAMYERGPMFQNTGLAWDAFPDYLADRRAVYIADAIAAYRGDPIMRELYPEKFEVTQDPEQEDTPKLVAPLDTIKSSRCRNCGSDTWIVDSNGTGKFWLLCFDPYQQSCVNTIELPADVRVT